MSSLNSLNRSVLRISGLNSGLDTDAIVQQMLRGSQLKLDRQFRTQTTLQWKQDKHIEINKMLKKFKDDFSTSLKQEQHMLSLYNYKKYSVRMGNESDSAYLSATAHPHANAGTLTIDYVKQLATAARYESSVKATGAGGNGINVTDTLGTIHNQMVAAGGSGFAFAQDGSLKFALDGESFSFDVYTSMDKVISTVNARCKNITMGYSQITDQFTISGKTTGANSEIGNIFSGTGAASFLNALHIYSAPPAKGVSSGRVTGNGGGGIDVTQNLSQISDQLEWLGGLPFSFGEGGALRLNLGGVNFSFGPNETMQDVMDAINQHSPDFDISYNDISDKFFITGKNGGEPNLDFASMDSATRSFLASLKITEPMPSSFKEGQNAIFSVNGHETQRSDNKFTLDGVDIALKRTFNETGDQQGKNIMLTVERDVQSSVDMIKKYVEAYNEVLSNLYEMLGETRAKDPTTKVPYQPLTEAEKAELSEKQIEDWEKLAKQGIMRNDNALTNLLSQMRGSLTTKALGSDKYMTQIGIKGMSWLAGSNMADARMGKLEVDEITLREALQNNPDEVFAMFTADSPTGNIDEMGFTKRLNTLMDGYIKYNEDVTQYYNKQDLSRAEQRYNDMLDKMYKEEQRLWAKFTRLETIMSNANAQQSWLTQQLSG